MMYDHMFQSVNSAFGRKITTGTLMSGKIKRKESLENVINRGTPTLTS
jgi:hypothetical protein